MLAAMVMALLAVGCGSRTFEQVGGTVVDARTREPVAQAEVRATAPGATEVSATTDAQGMFILQHGGPAAAEVSWAGVSIWATPVRSVGARREVPAHQQEDTMTHYLLSVHTVEGETREPMTDQELRQSHQQLGSLEQEMKSTGAWVFSGRLHEPDTATVVRMSAGEVVTTDGPFVESKEHLGGFYIIQAADLDAALAWASRVTATIKVPIEVRPFAGFQA